MLSKKRFSRLVGPACVLVVSGSVVGARADECASPVPSKDAAAAPARPDRRMMLLTQIERLSREKGAALCFVENPTQEQLENILALYQALPPALVDGFGPRFFSDGTVWTGNGLQGASGRAQRTNLTISFPNDGPQWGLTTSPNNLNATFSTLFGAANIDRGRELIRQGLASWRRYNGITYTEVADDNTAMTQATSHSNARGDIRIGCIPQGTSSGVLAYDYFPNGGSDMTLNSDQFTSSTLSSTGNNYRYLRNVVSHEHGHGLGFIHSVPCNGTKMMEPFANTNFDGIQIDEIRGAARNYGDKFAGNNSGATAADFGNLTTPVVHSVVEKNLSTNGTGGTLGTSEDWFKFTIDSTQNVTITVTPTGGNYTEGQQSSGCNGTTAAVNAIGAGNLAVELRNGTNGSTVVQSATSQSAGTAETVTMPGLTPGTYWVRVVDQGPNATADQYVQTYDLTVRVGTSKAPPVAIAGVNKRIQANTTCYFMGNVNSFTTDTGPTGGANAITSYAWDLDGDGVFGGANDSSLAQPTRQYVSNGTYNVTLRVNDSNSMTDTDTIQVVVWGATASLTAVSPSSLAPGLSSPVTITGVNLKGVTSASQITVSGGGVTVSGTPVVNAMGTTITGLTFTVGAGVAGSPRDVIVTNSDGSNSASGNATGVGLFTVTGNCTQPSIAQQPVNRLGCPGGSISFSILTQGSASTYVWRKGTVPLIGGVGTNISGQDTATLTINPVGTLDIGSYDCVVTNPCGTATSSAATLDIDHIAFINIQPSPQDICQGDTAVFSVSAAGSSQSFQWRRDGDPIIGASTATYRITNAMPADSGDYDCVVTTLCGVVTSSSAGLTVEPSVAFTTQPSPVAACSGGTATFTVAVSDPTATLQWRKGGNDIPGQTGPTLTISPVHASDAGSYDVTATGNCNVATSTAATLSLCPADFNCSGSLTVQDIFDFLSAWFSGAASADFNGTNGITVQDIFDFLSAWFNGC